MATRARIGVLRPDGRVESIYNHYDGYAAGGLGNALNKHYRNPEVIDKLIALGGRRGLYDAIYDNEKDLYKEPSRFDENEEAFYNNKRDSDIEYKYLFKDGDWFINGHEANGKLTDYLPKPKNENPKTFNNPKDMAKGINPSSYQSKFAAKYPDRYANIKNNKFGANMSDEDIDEVARLLGIEF